jgi:Fic family protein
MDKIPDFLPLQVDLETKAVLKKLSSANKALAELKGMAKSIPNENILIETLALREAKESSGIENIISTMAEVYQSSVFEDSYSSANAKEIHAYAEALKKGFALVKENGLITNKIILEIQRILEGNNAGFRKLPGTKLLNDKTGQVVFTPPQDYETIVQLMQNLEQYINDDSLEDIDPLIKMAIIHHQFESIHPFYDGNGRTGRIINILYLVQKGLLDLPILYLSNFIINTKSEYYKLLQEVRQNNTWESWVMYMLEGIEQTAIESIHMINEIRILMQNYKQIIKKEMPKIYSQDLINSIFKRPYTKAIYLEEAIGISAKTATRYLEDLVSHSILVKQKIGRNVYYVNERLFGFLGG